jgi:tetratricopeptide (TPR) repeat protein
MRSNAKAAICLALSLPFAACRGPDPYLSGGKRAERERAAELLSLLDREGNSGESRFAAVQRLSGDFSKRGEYGKLVNFLTAQVRRRPDDPYAAYYLFLAAHAYLAMGSKPMASLYFHRVVRNYPDLAVRGESIHLACLRELIGAERDPARRTSYYREILARFPSEVDQGAMGFMLGQAYEELGDWDLAIQAYKSVIPFPETAIPGFPGAYQYACKTVDFANSSKDWTFEGLDALVAAVRKAIAARDAYQLKQIKAKVNFFAMSWVQEESDENSQVDFDLSAFMGNGSISCSPDLDPGSNSREAYLRTTGWTDRIPVWYLYFRKIDFPANPDIHGRWEWAGIYFGDKRR